MSVSRIKLSDLKASLENQDGQAVEVDVKNVEATAVGAPKDASVEAGKDSVKDSSADEVTVGFDDPTEETAEALKQGEEIHRDLEKFSDVTAALEAYIGILNAVTDRNETVSVELAQSIRIGLRSHDHKYFNDVAPSLEDFGAPTDRMRVSLELLDNIKGKLGEVAASGKEALAKVWEWLKAQYDKAVAFLGKITERAKVVQEANEYLNAVAKIIPEGGGPLTGKPPEPPKTIKLTITRLLAEAGLPEKGPAVAKSESVVPDEIDHEYQIKKDNAASLDRPAIAKALSNAGVVDFGIGDHGNNEARLLKTLKRDLFGAIELSVNMFGTGLGRDDTREEIKEQFEAVIKQNRKDSFSSLALSGNVNLNFREEDNTSFRLVFEENGGEEVDQLPQLSIGDILMASSTNGQLCQAIAQVQDEFRRIDASRKNAEEITARYAESIRKLTEVDETKIGEVGRLMSRIVDCDIITIVERMTKTAMARTQAIDAMLVEHTESRRS